MKSFSFLVFGLFLGVFGTAIAYGFVRAMAVGLNQIFQILA